MYAGVFWAILGSKVAKGEIKHTYELHTHWHAEEQVCYSLVCSPISYTQLTQLVHFFVRPQVINYFDVIKVQEDLQAILAQRE